MIKALKETRIGMFILQHKKGLGDRPIANIILSGEKRKAFHLKSAIK
jgi:hypothetical protein